MSDSASPLWDVHGLLLLVAAQQNDQVAYRLRCYRDGHCTFDVDNTTFPIPATMTAHEWLETFYRSRFGAALGAAALGD